MTTPTEIVHVDLADRSYDIEIGSGNLDGVGRCLSECGKVSHAVVITDENVQQPHAIRVAEKLGVAGIEVDVIAVKPGESSKSVEMAAGLWDGLLELGTDRKSGANSSPGTFPSGSGHTGGRASRSCNSFPFSGGAAQRVGTPRVSPPRFGGKTYFKP